MNDYIKREDVEQIFTEWCHKEQISVMFCDVIMRRLQRLPSADVVEVVRCKDCKHHEDLLNNNDGNVLCWVHGIDVVVDRNGYCNYGERKEQEHE